ncbi:MAG: cadmium-translocating P-type ATPase [Bacilli bacterium]|nr:cadmium-translocating P-type ATPase [Bacilli bacterium]
MSKKVIYHISGFDCPNCAAKVERFLNKEEYIQNATIDFTNERMYITYREEPLDVEKLKEVIKTVESDPLRIERIHQGRKVQQKLFDKKTIFNLSRIVFSTILLLVGIFAFDEETQFLIQAIFIGISALICLYDIIWKLIQNIIHLRNPIDMNLLLTLSSLGVLTLSILIHYSVIPHGKFHIDLMDGAMVIILYQVGELFEHIASGKSKNAISNAIDLRADTANLITDNKVVEVKPETLKVGDKILVRIGEIVPADGEIIDGQGTLDTSSLTGEPMPVDALVGMNALSGSILRSGSITIRINKVFADSTISKILELVQSSGERKAKAEKFITKFARIYTPAVFLIGILFSIISGLVTHDWAQSIFGGLAILVVSCPCAIVISVPLAFFAGIGLASKRGVVIKGANYLDSLCKIGTVYIDKTGTLTYGDFKVSDWVTNGVKEEELKESLLAAESRSNHPIAKAICLHQNVSSLALKQENYEEVAGLGVKTEYEGNVILAGNVELLKNNGVLVEEVEVGGTAIYVAKNGKYIGYVVLKDVVRDKAKELVKKLNSIGIEVVLLSGDKESTVKEVADAVGIKKYHAKLLPQDKTKYVEKAIENRENGKLVAFAGDGINDTPSIIRADVGFAMGGIGSDVAVENSDVVIMQDHPLKIYDSIKIAKKTRRVAIFNIVFSLAVKVAVIILILTGVLGHMGMTVAVLADTGLTVLMTFNSLMLIYRKIE